MGWAGGSCLFSKIVTAAMVAIPEKETRKAFYRPIIEAFRDDDWDTMDECLWVDDAYDDIFREYYPPENYEPPEDDEED